MKLSEKIQYLRKENRYTQEEKACVCAECRRLGIPREQMQWPE